MTFSLSRRSTLAAVAATFALPTIVYAFPDRVIKLVVPYSPGTLTDTLSRILADELQRELGVSVIVENKAGANGMLGSSQVAKAAPDGNTLLMGGTSTHSTAPSLYKALPYDVEKDFELISILGEFDAILAVSSDSPVRDLKSLAASLSGPGGKAAYGYGAAIHQVAGAALLDRLKVTAAGVPYKGGPPALIDLIGGHLDFIFVDSIAGLPQIKGGKIRAIASAGRQRLPELPSLPTFAELGVPNFYFSAWLGVLAPANVPADRIKALQVAINKALLKPSLKEKISMVGRPYAQNGQTNYAEFIRTERQSWTAKIKGAGIQPE